MNPFVGRAGSRARDPDPRSGDHSAIDSLLVLERRRVRVMRERELSARALEGSIE